MAFAAAASAVASAAWLLMVLSNAGCLCGEGPISAGHSGTSGGGGGLAFYVKPTGYN